MDSSISPPYNDLQSLFPTFIIWNELEKLYSVSIQLFRIIRIIGILD